MRWHDLASGVHARTHSELELTTGLVLGSRRALVIDARGDHEQGAELRRAVRELTDLPLWLVITHGHFDHCFGGESLGAEQVWAHTGYPEFTSTTAAEQRSRWSAQYTAEGRTELAEALRGSDPVAATQLVNDRTELDLGGRVVRLEHPGPGHTGHDLVVTVPDASVVFAGDLVEQGGPPDFEDAFPAGWPDALEHVLRTEAEIIVPGHGTPVEPGFARRQHTDLRQTAALRDAVRAGELDVAEAVRRAPFPAETARTALAR